METIDTMNLIRGTILSAKMSIDRITAQAEFIQTANKLASEFNDESNSDIDRLMQDTPDDEADRYQIGMNTSWDGVTINVHLSNGQHISEIKPLLHKIVRTRLFHPAVYTEQDIYVQWLFKTVDLFTDNGYPTPRVLTVMVYFKDSGVCALKPTGNMIPEMKVVCDDGTTVDTPTSDTANLAGMED